MADFASILSGADPTAAAQAQAYELQRQGELQLGRPDTGIFSGLADVLAGQNLNRVPAMVGDIAQQKIAAQPDLARLLAADNPWAAVAADPTANPIAQAQILSSTPGDVATAKKTSMDAALEALTLGAYRNRVAGGGVTPVGRGMLPSGAVVPGPAQGAGGGGGAAAALPPAGSLGSGRYPQAAGGGVAEAPPVDATTVPAAQLPAFLQRLNPTQRAMALSRLRLRAARAPAGA